MLMEASLIFWRLDLFDLVPLVDCTVSPFGGKICIAKRRVGDAAAMRDGVFFQRLSLRQF